MNPALHHKQKLFQDLIFEKILLILFQSNIYLNFFLSDHKSLLHKFLLFLIHQNKIHNFLSRPILHSVLLLYRYFFGSKFNKIALMATMTVDTDIRIAPNAGLNVIPIGAKIPAARGIAIKL